MVVRKPSVIDIGKLCDTFSEVVDKEQFLFNWITARNDPKFYSIVVVNKKKVIGYLGGISQDKEFSIYSLLVLKDEYTLLLDKLIKDISPERIWIDAWNKEPFEEEGFVVVRTVHTLCLDCLEKEPGKEKAGEPVGVSKEDTEESKEDS